MKRGFSLVELSIVLVILGLLVGGVLSGRSLIHAAELRSVSNDFQKYHTAIMAFRDRYFALPGDITNASSFWGAADGGDGTGADCTTVVSTDATTCNGDGNGTIYLAEGYRAWQHLANAGLIEGQFAGTNDLVNAYATLYITPGFNVPASRIQKGGFALGSQSTIMTATYFGTPSLANRLMGRYTTLLRPLSSAAGTGGAGGNVFWGAVGHEDAWNIDTKMDDGLASTGKVRADITRAADITDLTCRTYDLTNTANYCVVAHIWGN